MARSDMTHVSICMLSGISDAKVPESIVGGRGLWETAVGLHFHGVNEIGKLDRILNEEHWNVVADEIEVSFLGVKLHCKAANVTRKIDRSGSACDRGEAH